MHRLWPRAEKKASFEGLVHSRWPLRVEIKSNKYSLLILFPPLLVTYSHSDTLEPAPTQISLHRQGQGGRRLDLGRQTRMAAASSGELCRLHYWCSSWHQMSSSPEGLTSKSSFDKKQGKGVSKMRNQFFFKEIFFSPLGNLLFQLMSQSKSLFCRNLKDINSGHCKGKNNQSKCWAET